jgi:hypothetical protein
VVAAAAAARSEGLGRGWGETEKLTQQRHGVRDWGEAVGDRKHSPHRRRRRRRRHHRTHTLRHVHTYTHELERFKEPRTRRWWRWWRQQRHEVRDWGEAAGDRKHSPRRRRRRRHRRHRRRRPLPTRAHTYTHELERTKRARTKWGGAWWVARWSSHAGRWTAAKKEWPAAAAVAL